jgi:hypothetical protein
VFAKEIQAPPFIIRIDVSYGRQGSLTVLLKRIMRGVSCPTRAARTVYAIYLRMQSMADAL